MKRRGRETLLTMSEVGAVLGRSRKSAWRWATQGINGIVLETECYGPNRTHYSTEAALDRFLERLEKSGARIGDMRKVEG